MYLIGMNTGNAVVMIPVKSSPLDTMAAILADDSFSCIFLNENDKIPIRISLKFVPMSPIDNKPALVQIMVWCRTDNKPLPGPMLTKLIDIYVALGGDD